MAGNAVTVRYLRRRAGERTAGINRTIALFEKKYPKISEDGLLGPADF
ncbi:hypothetical protein [Streptomyces sp. NPDC021356]